MLTHEENLALANLLFPNITETVADLEKKYPARTTLATRFAPSPTGFLHMGALYQCFAHEKIAHSPGVNGTFYLRIEDTDTEREVQGAAKLMIDGLKRFNVRIDEGPIGENESDIGIYGPYIQSKRVPFYHIVAKKLIAEGKAYPCFLTNIEEEKIREEQVLAKRVTGIYGSYASWREKSFSEYQTALNSGQSYALRLKCPVTFGTRVKVKDELRGVIEMDDNYLDIVLLKQDGIPTYHFAHAVDDHFMRTTIIVRAEEWFPSLPLHYQLFDACGFARLPYLHTAQLMKFDNGNKRKLSKSKDPESNAEYFFEHGYIVDAIMDYLANVFDSSFEAWKKENPGKNYKDYSFKIENMPKSGAIFDIVKLDSINKEYVSAMSHDEFFESVKKWAKDYAKDLFTLIEKHPDLAKAAMNIERLSEKDPKRFVKIADVKNQILPFFPEIYEELRKSAPAFPEHIPAEKRSEFLKNYAEHYNPNLSKDEWFADLKDFGHSLGFARNNEEFKQGGFVGKTGDLAMMLRISLLAATTTPDLWETLRVLGRDEVRSRLLSFC